MRIGKIEGVAPEPARSAPGSTAERIERLVDLFWRGGCRADLRTSRSREAQPPDVVCTLRGRRQDVVVVAAYVDSPRRSGAEWIGAALLPQLHAALSVEERENSFLFVGLTRRSRGGVPEDAKRLEEFGRGEVRALVDLRRLRAGASTLAFAASDPQLRRELSLVARSLDRGGEPLQLVAAPEPRGTTGRRGRVPLITLGSVTPARPDASGAAAPDRDTAFRSTARTLAVFLGYLDGKLGPRSETLAGEPAR